MTDLKKPVRLAADEVTPILIVTLYPGGVIGLRELRHRKEYTVALGTLYAWLVAMEKP